MSSIHTQSTQTSTTNGSNVFHKAVMLPASSSPGILLLHVTGMLTKWVAEQVTSNQVEGLYRRMQVCSDVAIISHRDKCEGGLRNRTKSKELQLLQRAPKQSDKCYRSAAAVSGLSSIQQQLCICNASGTCTQDALYPCMYITSSYRNSLRVELQHK